MDLDDLFRQAEQEFAGQSFEAAEKQYTDFIRGCERRKGEGGEVKAAYAESRERIPNLVTAYNNRGQIKYMRVDFDEAVEDYTAAIGVAPDVAVPYYNRGQIHYRLGRFDAAIADFTKALELQPDFPDAHINRQHALSDKQKRNQGFNTSDWKSEGS
ncbi:TTC32 [Branchiostoma lanceolatum]|uniref:TTC32 protein n=1 Tax=Branchiostoma lanceolatum TaxID=7740 RepID=A0A8K0EH93_BRALA|nr:TTC32 [Branchiostoma lanceolatum]